MEYRFCFLVGFALFVAQFGARPATANEIVIGTGEFPPFTTEITPDQGCAIKIVRSAFEAEGWSVDLKFLPWSRNLKLLSQGDIDASAYWMDRPDRREAYIFPKNPVTLETYKFVFKKGSTIDWSSYADLAGKTIIINQDYTYTGEFYAALEEHKIEAHKARSEDLNLKMLLKDRADLTIMSENVFEQYFNELTEQERATLEIDSKPALVNQGYIVFSKANPEESALMVQAFDQGYEKIRGAESLSDSFETCGF